MTVSSIVLLLGMIAVYGRTSLFDSDEAAELAVQAVEDPNVEANSRPVLADRIADCEGSGRPFANMIAVDFSDRGEVIPFVAALNGVDTS
jgi:hypothetical protein